MKKLHFENTDPEGIGENSPTFQRWVCASKGGQVPKGRLKTREASLLPLGLAFPGTSVSNAETLGYSRMSFPDTAGRNVCAPFLLAFAFIAALVLPAAGAPNLFWENTGSILCPPAVPPVIDAINFVNDRTAVLSINYATLGTIGNFESLPFFDTSDTLNFTNRGLLQVDTGWRFDTEPATIGQARWAANFDNSGEIDTATTSLSTSNLIISISSSGGPRTLVSATNIINSGIINSGFEGLVSLKGGNVNLSRGTIFMPQTGLSIGAGFIFLNQGFLDGYWASDTNVMIPQFQFEIPPPLTPAHLVTDRNYVTLVQQLVGVQSYLDDTGIVGSNRVVRAAFIQNTNTAFNVSVYFST